MIRFELEEKEKMLLKTLAKKGAMSPSQVAAETWILPGETLSLLRNLSGAGFVLLRNDTQSADGMLVAITADARSMLNGSVNTL